MRDRPIIDVSIFADGEKTTRFVRPPLRVLLGFTAAADAACGDATRRDRLESLTDRVRLLEDDVEQTVEAQRFTTRLLIVRNGAAERDGRSLLSSRAGAAEGGESVGIG